MSANARAFLADLAKTRNSHFDNISNIRRGDSDGEVSFKYSNDSLGEPLDIQILSTDVTEYPEGSTFMVFTSSETCHARVFSFLEQISSTTNGLTLQNVIKAVATELTAKLSPADICNSDTDASSDKDASDHEYYDSFEIDHGESFEFTRNTPPADVVQEPWGHHHEKEELQRLHKDLKAAQLAGIAVGIYPIQVDSPLEAISLSIRVSKLGIPLEAMSAWAVKATDYLVLLIRPSEDYPTLETLFTHNDTSSLLKFRFGKCESNKPSLESIRLAFGYGPNAKTYSDNLQTTGPTFCQVYMSDSINLLFKTSFARLFKLRRLHNSTWDEAQVLLAEIDQRVQSQSTLGANGSGTEDLGHEFPISAQAPPSLQHDYAMDDEEAVSFPLVAMQFALRRFCKCTEYCMVCTRRLRNDFDTIKPYVCSTDLCLYQYMSLGLGPNIEHEVIHNPYVVDLLISFFYAAVPQNGLRELPRALALRAPVIHHLQVHLEIETDLQLKTFRIIQGRNESRYAYIHNRLRDGDWFTMLIQAKTGVEKHTCRISAVLEGGRYSFETYGSVANPMEKFEVEISALATLKNSSSWQPGFIFPYEHDPDELDDDQRNRALGELLVSMPSVLQMRCYLLAEPGRVLSSWKRMNRSALSLMRWIVVSNTSYIVQEGPVVSTADEAEVEVDVTAVDSVNTASNTIRGLGKNWMQFRFAQGSPEKEFKFTKVLQEMTSIDPAALKPLSLFAWHGSPIHNWHSIIRTGLDFQSIRHGRSHGNGVYLSSSMSVSTGYSGRVAQNHGDSFYGVWPKSELRVLSALSICEVVNKPEEFVCSSPCFVIDKTEWIQCRYLLVQVNPTSEALNNRLFVPSGQQNTGYVVQDRTHFIKGPQDLKPLQIPLSAISVARRQAALGAAMNPSKSIVEDGGYVSDESDDESDAGDDPDILVDEFTKMDAAAKGLKRQRGISPGDNPEGTVLAESPCKSPKTSVDSEKKTIPSLDIAMVVSNSSIFQPGKLDGKAIRQLPPPSWATSSSMALQTLTREFKQIHTVQSQSDIATLGWYVDTSTVENLFQWIVQFHSFDPSLPLAKDMDTRGITSIMLEFRFGRDYPMSPPFVRVIRPRFLPFLEGGGGHVTAGGAICSEMLTNSGWSPVMSMESVFLQIRLGLCDTHRPAKLDMRMVGSSDYSIGEAIQAYIRAANNHGWSIPEDLQTIQTGWMDV